MNKVFLWNDRGATEEWFDPTTFSLTLLSLSHSAEVCRGLPELCWWHPEQDEHRKTNTLTLTHTHKQTYRPFGAPNSPLMHVFGLWEETRDPGENPHRHIENMQASHRNASWLYKKKKIYSKMRCIPSFKTWNCAFAYNIAKMHLIFFRELESMDCTI